MAQETDIYFSQSWRLEGQGHGHCQFSSRHRRAFFLASRLALSLCPHRVETEQPPSPPPPVKPRILSEGPQPHDLTNPNYLPKAPHLQIPSHWGTGLQHVNLGWGPILSKALKVRWDVGWGKTPQHHRQAAPTQEEGPETLSYSPASTLSR